MPGAIDALLSILDLEPLEHNLFRGRSPQVGWQRVFGGQVVGQALVAAARTVEGRIAHSLHGYFLRPGDPTVPILYEVHNLPKAKEFMTPEKFSSCLTSEEISDLASRSVFSSRSRRAFVVASSLQFGLSRMFAAYREEKGRQETMVFRDLREALAWLNLPPDWKPTAVDSTPSA